MKKYIYLLWMSLAVVSCSTPPKIESEAENQWKTEREAMMAESASKDSILNSLMYSMNEIETNLDSIKVKQKIVMLNSANPEMQKSQPERIVDDITAIKELLDKNKASIRSLSNKLKKSNIKIAELEKIIARLESQIVSKDDEIATLREELERKNTAIKSLFVEYNERVKELGSQEERLNTAYYAIGTTKELISHGVLTKEGGFAGIGRNTKISSTFNKDYFTKINIQEILEISLKAKKVKLLSTHPANSYRIDGEQTADKLVITNIDEFWSASKYLVIVVD